MRNAEQWLQGPLAGSDGIGRISDEIAFGFARGDELARRHARMVARLEAVLDGLDPTVVVGVDDTVSTGLERWGSLGAAHRRGTALAYRRRNRRHHRARR